VTVPDTFERDMGCTEAELWRCLPQALAGCDWVAEEQGFSVQWPPHGGRLQVRWAALPPRRLGLAVIPRLGLRFCFDGVSADVRHAWLQRFDLYTRRGGG
jgi:hypothetical protein